MLRFFVQGGWVMYPILVESFAALAVVIERLIFFVRIRNDDARLLQSVLSGIRHGGPPAARAACASSRGPVRRLIEGALDAWDSGVSAVEERVTYEGNRAIEHIERHLGVLSVVAQSAPLLGLLGTVTGMIEAFMVVQGSGGSADPVVLAGGIWEALLTTAFGLIVAIPALLAHHFFDAHVARYVGLLRETGEGLVRTRGVAP